MIINFNNEFDGTHYCGDGDKMNDGSVYLPNHGDSS